jgi:hypothetical protein
VLPLHMSAFGCKTGIMSWPSSELKSMTSNYSIDVAPRRSTCASPIKSCNDKAVVVNHADEAKIGLTVAGLALSALFSISRNCFFKVVLHIFEGTELTGAIIQTTTIPYAVAIYSSIFRYFSGSVAIATDCLLAVRSVSVGKASMEKANRESQCEYALLHLYLLT